MLSPRRGDARHTKMTKTALTTPKPGVKEITINATQPGTSSHGDEAGLGHTGGLNSAWADSSCLVLVVLKAVVLSASHRWLPTHGQRTLVHP